MKISELIAQLQHCQEKVGDIEVVAYKNGQWLDTIEKIVHIEAVRNVGTPDAKSTPEQKKQWQEDPQSQPNAGWLKLPIRGLDAKIINDDTKHRKLYIGPKIVVTS